jgi:hypothetical protein
VELDRQDRVQLDPVVRDAGLAVKDIKKRNSRHRDRDSYYTRAANRAVKMASMACRTCAISCPKRLLGAHCGFGDDRAPGGGVGAVILSSVGCSVRLPQSAE